MRNQTRIRTRETGSAFVISILVMFVLTVLGMALMLTTSTEADIATNYRWGEMAFFNADAALEYAKNVLADQRDPVNGFRDLLPVPRTPGPQMSDKPVLPSGLAPASRDFQYSIDQGGVKVYIGTVLFDRRRAKALQFDYRQPGTGLAGGELFRNQQDLQGTATIWVRRPVVGPPIGDPDPRPRDDLQNHRVIITAEGTAPNFESQDTGRPGAKRRLEMTIRVLSEGVLGLRYDCPTCGSDFDSSDKPWESTQNDGKPRN